MTEFGSIKNIISKIIRTDMKVALGGAALILKPMEAVREIIRQQITGLHLITLIGDLDVDLLVGTGALKELSAAYVGLPMIGMAQNFRNAVEQNKLVFHEWTELSMVRAFQAGAMGVPFLPIRSILGSDLVEHRKDFSEIEYHGVKYIQIPAITPDLAIVHAFAADPQGNVYYPNGHILDEFSTLPALCSKKLLVTVEKLITLTEGRQLREQIMFPFLEVDYIAETPRGAWPSGFPPLYGSEMGHYMSYAGVARSLEAFQSYLQEYVHQEVA